MVEAVMVVMLVVVATIAAVIGTILEGVEELMAAIN